MRGWHFHYSEIYIYFIFYLQIWPRMLEMPPISCRQPLPVKELEYEHTAVFLRVLYFDPAPVYERMAQNPRASVSPFKRINSIFMADMFPTVEPGVCACGCGGKCTGRRTRWATKECSQFALRVYWIICGVSDKGYSNFIYHYWGYGCTDCAETGIDTQIDHIIPVHAGGGLCWLSNLRPLCIPCHKEKTKADRLKY